MPSIRLRRIHAAENPLVIGEVAQALSARWAAQPQLPSGTDASYHAGVIVGMFAAMADESEVAMYLQSIEHSGERANEAEAAFAAELLRIVLRLDEVGGRPGS
jgi:2-methylisocitrate lyase-like PEP mutase family enzyme